MGRLERKKSKWNWTLRYLTNFLKFIFQKVTNLKLIDNNVYLLASLNEVVKPKTNNRPNFGGKHTASCTLHTEAFGHPLEKLLSEHFVGINLIFTLLRVQGLT